MENPVLFSKLLRAEKVAHGFTTRHLLHSFIDPHYLEKRFVVSLEQVHGDGILLVENVHNLPKRSGRLFDAAVTKQPGLTLCVRTADCVPILLYSKQPQAVAAVHAGWKGTLATIVPKAVQAMERYFGCRPEQMLSAIGPCIHSCCYEVGPEVFGPFYKAFGKEVAFQDQAGRLKVNLPEANLHLLRQAGVLDANIDVLEDCTFCRKDLFYSYRRDGAGTGRQLAFIGLGKEIWLFE